MTIQQFTNSTESHQHSLQFLNLLAEYDTFMESVDSMVDLGCGSDGLDLEWWASRTTRDDEEAVPLNIKCTGVDLAPTCAVAQKYSNASYLRHDFETPFVGSTKYDVLWCHDAFQYALNPLATLRNWHSIAADGAMLCMSIPSYTNIAYNRTSFELPSSVMFAHTIPSLIGQLVMTGWDCSDGMFHKAVGDPWIHLVAYKSDSSMLDPRTTNWYQLAETGRLSESMVKCINKYGHIVQHELTLQWLDKNLYWMGHE